MTSQTCPKDDVLLSKCREMPSVLRHKTELNGIIAYEPRAGSSGQICTVFHSYMGSRPEHVGSHVCVDAWADAGNVDQ